MLRVFPSSCVSISGGGISFGRWSCFRGGVCFRRWDLQGGNLFQKFSLFWGLFFWGGVCFLMWSSQGWSLCQSWSLFSQNWGGGFRDGTCFRGGVCFGRLIEMVFIGGVYTVWFCFRSSLFLEVKEADFVLFLEVETVFRGRMFYRWSLFLETAHCWCRRWTLSNMEPVCGGGVWQLQHGSWFYRNRSSAPERLSLVNFLHKQLILKWPYVVDGTLKSRN